jgi:hypothetical protein
MALLRKLLAKQKADREEAERKHEARLEKRRGYARAARERERSKHDGLADLPVEVAFAIEQAPTMPAPEAVKVAEELLSVEELVSRLTAIRERLFWLQAVWANSLSPDVYQEAESYRILFQNLSEQLRGRDPAALDRIVAGHEALLLSEPGAPKPSVPLATQRLFELAAEIQSVRSARPASTPNGYVADGLQGFI